MLFLVKLRTRLCGRLRKDNNEIIIILNFKELLSTAQGYFKHTKNMKWLLKMDKTEGLTNVIAIKLT